jgi:hypothetical protein
LFPHGGRGVFLKKNRTLPAKTLIGWYGGILRPPQAGDSDNHYLFGNSDLFRTDPTSCHSNPDLTYLSRINENIFHSLMDEILFKKAQVMERQSLWVDALGFYDLIITKYPKDILADDALFKSAKIYENQLNDSAKALEVFMNLLLNYSGSLFTDDARKQTRLLRGDKIIED